MKTPIYQVMLNSSSITAAALLTILLCGFAAYSQTTFFNFAATVPTDITPATGTFEMNFRLFDAAMDGAQIGVTVSIAEVAVKNRAFAVQLDFGPAAFPGADRFVEISVRETNLMPFAIIAPRTKVLSAPYAIRALSAESANTAGNAATADTATNALNLGGVGAGEYVQTTESRLSDSRAPLPGSDNYIQNGSTAQTPANFNISGNGTAGGTLSGNVIDTQTHYKLGGARILSRTGSSLFVGALAGINTTGAGNAFFGSLAGRDNIAGGFNSFFGNTAGINNETGNQNSFFGLAAGFSNISGSNNAAFGGGAGFSNTTGNLNSYFGAGTNSADGLNNATAIGAGAFVSASNTVVLGRNVDTVQIPGNLNVSGAFTGNTLTVGGNAAIGGAVNAGTQYNIGGNQVLTRARLDLFNNAGTGGYSLEVLDLPRFLVMKNDLGTSLLTVTPDGKLEVAGTIAVAQLGSNGSTPLCLGTGNVISTCSSIANRSDLTSEQQEQIQKLNEQIRRQQLVINGLKNLVCETNPRAEICKPEEK